jgi:hypothetical protein
VESKENDFRAEPYSLSPLGEGRGEGRFGMAREFGFFHSFYSEFTGLSLISCVK